MHAKFLHVIIPFLLLLLPSYSIFQVYCYPVQVTVQNNATIPIARQRFDIDIGKQYTIDLVTKEIVPFIWKIYNQPTDADRKQVPPVGVIVRSLADGIAGQTGEGNIYVNDKFIATFPPGPVQARVQFKTLMYHETTHIFQWNGQGKAPGGLTEGIADYTVLKAKLVNGAFYTKPGSGNKWDEGYGVTARFLEYCDTLKPGFTAALNNKIRNDYRVEYFQELLGKPVDVLWRDYKAKYGQRPRA